MNAPEVSMPRGRPGDVLIALARACGGIYQRSVGHPEVALYHSLAGWPQDAIPHLVSLSIPLAALEKSHVRHQLVAGEMFG